MPVIYKPNVFSNKLNQYHVFKHGSYTLTELIDKCDIEENIKPYIVVQINGKDIPQEWWSRIKPKDCHILIACVPRGGDSSKSILRIVATIALTYFTFGAGAVFGGGTAAAFAGNTAVFIAGTLAINALFPPPEVGSKQSGSGESEQNFITGQRNQLRPNQPVPRVYGKHRIYPMLAAVPYTQTYFKNQFLHMILDCGYGPLTISDIRIGETPISQYEGVHVSVIEESINGSELTYFVSAVDNLNVGVALKENEPVIRVTSDNTKSIDIDISFPAGLVRYNREGKRRLTEVDIDVSYRKVGDSEWLSYGFADNWQSERDILNDGTTSPNWGLNTQINNNIRVAEQVNLFPRALEITAGGAIITVVAPAIVLDPENGLNVNNSIPLQDGYPVGTTELNVNTSSPVLAGSLFFINGQKYKTVSPIAQGDNQTMVIDPPLKQTLITTSYSLNPETGARVNLTNFSYGGTVLSQEPRRVRIQDRTSKPFVNQIKLTFPESGQYEVQLIRRTANYSVEENRIQNDTTWQTLRSFQAGNPYNFRVPHTIIELRIKATDQLQGTIDTLNCLAESKLKVWNGSSFELQNTRSPSWILYDVLTGSANQYALNDDDIDLQSFVDWDLFCSEPAINDNVNNEPRFLCDVIIDGNQTIHDVIKNIASSGRATTTVRNGNHSVIWDKEPAIPVQLITTHNSWGFQASKSFGDPPHAVKVGFVDPDSNWQKREHIVYADGYDSTNAQNYQSINRYGCIRASQAWRDGRYDLAQAILRLEEITISMDIENIVCERGDFVLLQHDVARIGGLPDRIKSVEGTQITTYEPITMDLSINNYSVRIRESDGQLITYTVVNQIDSNTIEINGAGNYQSGDLVVWGIQDIVTEEYLVKSIQPANDFAATLKLTPLARPIYSADTGPIPDYSAIISPELGIIPPLVQNIVVNHTYSYSNGTPLIDLFLVWDDQDEAITRGFEIYVRFGETWRYLELISENEYFFFQRQDVIAGWNGTDIIDREFCFKVLAVGPTGLKHEIEKAIEICYYVSEPPYPDDVQNFNISVTEGTIALDWDLVQQSDVVRYEMRYSPDPNSFKWEASSALISVSGSTRATSVNARVGSYGIKAINALGKRSRNASIARTQIPAIEGLNIVEFQEGQPDWLGTFSQMDRIGNTVASGLISEGKYFKKSYYYFDGFIDLGSVYEVRASAFIESAAKSDNDFMEAWPNLLDSSVPSLIRSGDDLWDSYLEVRTSDAAVVVADWQPTLSTVSILADASTVDWGQWRRFYAADITGQLFQFRLSHTTQFDDIQVVTTTAKAVIDMLDRVYGDDNIIIPVGGSRINYDPPFRVPPALAISIDNSSEGDYYVLNNSDENGFDIEGFGSGGSSKQMQIDFVAKGYGKIRPETLKPTT